jgi:hypothetical protein
LTIVSFCKRKVKRAPAPACKASDIILKTPLSVHFFHNQPRRGWSYTYYITKHRKTEASTEPDWIPSCPDREGERE